MSYIGELFTEKYRPKKLEDVILLPRIRRELEKGLTQNFILCSSSPGTGKTTIGRVLSQGYDQLYINASSERGIDVLRSKINDFCSSYSLEDGGEKPKVVFLDEFDNSTNDFYLAFRAVLEKFTYVRFICTCNYINQIPEPILSRFNVLKFDTQNIEEEKYLLKEYILKVAKVLTELGISFEKKILFDFVKNYFPDMRSLYNKIQSLYTRGTKELLMDVIQPDFDYDTLFKMCFDKSVTPQDNYKLIVSEYSNKVDDVLSAFVNDFPKYMELHHPDSLSKLPLIIITIAEHENMKSNVRDVIIVLLSLVFKIQQILK